MPRKEFACKYAISPVAVYRALRQWVKRHGREEYALVDWGTYFQPTLEMLACDPDLGRTAYKILLLSAASVGRQNTIPCTQVELAEKLGITRQSVHEAMQTLMEKKLIEKQGRTYTLNAHIASTMGLVEIMRLQQEEEKRLCEVEQAHARRRKGRA